MLATSPQVTWDSQKSTLYQRLDATRTLHTARWQACHTCAHSLSPGDIISASTDELLLFMDDLDLHCVSCKGHHKRGRNNVGHNRLKETTEISPQFSRPEVPGIYVVTLPEPVSFGGRWQTSPDVLAHIFFPLHVSFSFIFVKIILGFTLKYSLKSSHL